MASVYNYNFDNLTRIGDDKCGITARELQNNAMGSYNTTNYFLNDCGMKKSIGFATQQPNVFFKGGHGICGAGGCNVSSDSNLRIGTIQTHPKCKISLQQRPFATVPYLGRGPPRPVLEARLQQGAMVNDPKSCKTITESSFKNYSRTPLVPSLANTIQNPNNLVEGVASEGWIRGGLPSRDLTRDQDYIEHN